MAGISGRRCSAAISSESKWILTTAGDGIPCVWNKEDLKLEKTGQPDVYVYEYLTGGELAKLSTDSSTDLLSVPDPQIRGRYPKWAQVSPDGKYYSVESDSGISIYRTSDDSQVCTAENADYVIFSGDRALVWRRRQSQVSIFDLNSGAQLCDPICCKPAALHGDHLVFFRKDKGLYYRALNSKEAPDIDLDWSETCDGLQYSPDGKYLIQFGRGYIAARDTQRYQILHLRQFSRYAEFFCGNKTVAVEDDDPDALGRTLITICRIDTLEPVSFVHIDGSPTEHTSRYILAYEDQGLLIYRSEDTLHYYRITDAGVEFVGPITLVPGLDVKGVDLRNLHSNSVFSDRQKQILGQYGAII